MDNAQDALRGVDIMDEKKEMTRFFKELIKENGCAAYGEESVRANLEAGAVDTLLLSEKLRKARLTIECGNCGYQEVKTLQVEAGKSSRIFRLVTVQNVSLRFILQMRRISSRS